MAALGRGLRPLLLPPRADRRAHARVVGWRSVTDNLDFDRYHFDLQPGAGRFEEGTPNTPGIFALGAAIDLLLELGVEAIGRRVLELGDALCAGLAPAAP